MMITALLAWPLTACAACAGRAVYRRGIGVLVGRGA